MKRLILALALVFGALGAPAQTRIYLSTTNGVYTIQSLQIGGQIFTNLAGIGLTNDQGVLKVIGGLGGGDAYLAANQIFTGTNQFAGPLALVADLYANSLTLATPGPISSGFTGAGTAAGARANLDVEPDVDVQAFRLPLLQLYVALAADGDMPYRNASGVVTNVTSTAAGRALLAAALASDQLTLIGALAKAGDTATGPIYVPYVAYNANWTNATSNGIPTWRAIAEKIEALSIGAYVSSVDTNHEVVGGQLRLANLEPGASGTLVRKSQLDSLAVVATNSVIVEVLTNATGIWSKSALAKSIRVLAFGSGGGGGSGAQGTNPYAGGGGGGSGAGFIDWTFSASELPASLTYSNGIGGLGAVGQTTNLSVGIAGNAGTTMFFGTILDVGPLLQMSGGGGGRAGILTGGAAGASVASTMYAGSAGHAGSAVGNASSGGLVSGRPGGSAGGGGGGGYSHLDTTTNTPSSGGSSVHATTASGGAAGTVDSINGSDGVTRVLMNSGYIPRPATGGGGGYPGFGVSGNGGNGGWPGGGGGGGAGARSGTVSGAGGNGADGVIVVISFL